MQKEKAVQIEADYNRQQYCLKPPSLFELPMSDYAAEMERVRDKSLFHKVKQLAETSEQIREGLKLLLDNHFKHVERANMLIAKSYEVNRRFINRKMMNTDDESMT